MCVMCVFIVHACCVWCDLCSNTMLAKRIRHAFTEPRLWHLLAEFSGSDDAAFPTNLRCDKQHIYSPRKMQAHTRVHRLNTICVVKHSNARTNQTKSNSAQPLGAVTSTGRTLGYLYLSLGGRREAGSAGVFDARIRARVSNEDFLLSQISRARVACTRLVHIRVYAFFTLFRATFGHACPRARVQLDTTMTTAAKR